MGDGAVYEINVETGATVRQLKQAIEERWLIPTECQTIINDDQILGNVDRLHGNDAEHIAMTLVISVEDVCSQLECECVTWREKIKRMQILARLGDRCKGNEHSVSAVINQLEDVDVDVRATALDTLSIIVDKGDERAIHAATLR